MFLKPVAGVTDAGYHDPYTESGARSIIRRFQHDVLAMLRHMLSDRAQFNAGRTMLARSPLHKKVWVAAAMKTLGMVEEHETPNGSCVLTLTERGIKTAERLGLEVDK